VSLDNAWSSAQPPGFGIKDGNFADNSQYIASADGRLFNRNAGAAVQAMNAPWLSTPVFIPGNGKIGEIWDPFSTGARTPGFSFMHDQANNRLLTLFFTRNTSLPTGAKI